MDTRTTEQRLQIFTSIIQQQLADARDKVVYFQDKNRPDRPNHYRGETEALTDVLAMLELAGLTPQETE